MCPYLCSQRTRETSAVLCRIICISNVNSTTRNFSKCEIAKRVDGDASHMTITDPWKHQKVAYSF